MGDPGVVARALARASLASSAHRRPGSACLAMADSDITTRVRALQGRPPRFRPWAAAAVLSIALAASTVAVSLTFAVHGQAELAQFVSAQAASANAGARQHASQPEGRLDVGDGVPAVVRQAVTGDENNGGQHRNRPRSA
jgi:hypothetical protein